MVLADGLTPSKRYYQKHKAARQQYGRDYYAKNRAAMLAAAAAKRDAKIEASATLFPLLPMSRAIIQTDVTISFD
jgi:hypothetical protein